jgi:hypothetical protein
MNEKISEMNARIEAFVKQYPMLRFQVNKGERYRITRSGIRRGSLWVEARSKTNRYFVTPTGEVADEVSDFLLNSFGGETSKDYRGRSWHVSEIGVSKIIQRFAER